MAQDTMTSTFKESMDKAFTNTFGTYHYNSWKVFNSSSTDTFTINELRHKDTSVTHWQDQTAVVLFDGYYIVMDQAEKNIYVTKYAKKSKKIKLKRLDKQVRDMLSIDSEPEDLSIKNTGINQNEYSYSYGDKQITVSIDDSLKYILKIKEIQGGVETTYENMAHIGGKGNCHKSAYDKNYFALKNNQFIPKGTFSSYSIYKLN